MAGETRDRVEWVDKGLDGLRKEVDGHFTRQGEELEDLRKEVERLTLWRPSILARWGLATLPKASLDSWETSTSWDSPSMPPSGLCWTEGRVADLKSHISNASTQASDQVSEIKAQIKTFDKEASERRSNRQRLLFILYCVTISLGLLIAKGVALLLA